MDVTSHVTIIEQTADELLAHFRTTSLYFEIEPANRRELEGDHRKLIEGLGGAVTFSLATLLMTAQRTHT